MYIVKKLGSVALPSKILDLGLFLSPAGCLVLQGKILIPFLTPWDIANLYLT